MSSPNMDNDSHTRNEEVLNETPTTTPPAPPTDNETPGPEHNQSEQQRQRQSDDMDVDMDLNINQNQDPMTEQQQEEDSGSISLPLSKIKRIFKMDPEYFGSSQSAVFATGVATEIFIQYFTEQAAALAKMDKRKKILYKDFSGAVAAQDPLHFLSDTVPKTVPLKHVLNETESSTVASKNTTTNSTNNQGNPSDDVNESGPGGGSDVPQEVKPERKRVDIKSMLPISGKSSSPNQQPASPPPQPQPVKKATINDLVSNDDEQNSEEQHESIIID